MVQGRGHLRAPRARLRRLERRRPRRLQGARTAPRLSPPARGHRDLAASVLPLTAARRRVRHCRLHEHPSRLRHLGGLPAIRRGGSPARYAGDHRASPQPYERPAPLVPACAPRRSGKQPPRLLCLERYPRALRAGSHHLPRLRTVQLVLGPGGEGLLLAPLLLTPAGPQLPQSRGSQVHVAARRLLAPSRGRRAAARRGSLSLRARGNRLREPARDA